VRREVVELNCSLQIRISVMPYPSGSESPKFPWIALWRWVRILAFAFRSERADNHASKKDDRI